MQWTFRRGRGRPPRRSLVGSFLVHGGIGALALATTLQQPMPPTFITYEIEIVSPPPRPVEAPEDSDPAPEVEEFRVERPDETPQPDETDALPPPDAEPDPEPEVEEEPDPTPPEPEADPEPVEEETPPAATDEPDEESELSGEDIEVRMEGLRRDYPVYYENIIRQIRRCFRPPPGVPAGLETTVYFVIRADGSTADEELVEQSGNFEFDFEALGAIADCAGKGRFGPLPDDLPYERLPIRFRFRPSGDQSPPAAQDAGTRTIDVISLNEEGTAR